VDSEAGQRAYVPFIERPVVTKCCLVFDDTVQCDEHGQQPAEVLVKHLNRSKQFYHNDLLQLNNEKATLGEHSDYDQKQYSVKKVSGPRLQRTTTTSFSLSLITQFMSNFSTVKTVYILASRSYLPGNSDKNNKLILWPYSKAQPG